ncbi:TPA: hypothetical protein LA460_000611 [Clostridium botulinum]|nr:hypothetical protein [Clostridium botulinum]HBJ1653199.1 hypothetical protein [Clostridium botulinum]
MNGKNLTNSEISDILMDYINDDRKKQAVLLDGKWGAGKTYFITEYFKKEFENKNKEKKLIYLSLYGKQNPREIEEDIKNIYFEQYISQKLSENKRNGIGNVIDHVGTDKVKTIGKFAYKMFTSYAKSKDFEIDDLPSISEWIIVKNAVIIFDDLERCCMNINEILGYINNLTEHYDVKAIIIANEEELGAIYHNNNLPIEYLVALKYNDSQNNTKQDKAKQNDKIDKDKLKETAEEIFLKDSMYDRIKEKVIGLVIKYNVNLEDLYEELINEKYIRDYNIREYLHKKENKKRIIKAFIDDNNYNLRTLIFALTAFEKFAITISELDCEQKYKDIIMKNIVDYCIYSSIQIKNGNKNFITKIIDNINNDECKEEYYYYKLNYKTIPAYKFVDKYLLYSYYNEDQVKNILQDSINEKIILEKEIEERKKKEKLSLNRLIFWYEMEDEDIYENLKILKNELTKKLYKIRDFKDIIVILFQLKHNDFDIDMAEYIDLIKNSIKNIKKDIDIEVLRIYTEDPKFKEEYNKLVEPLVEILKKNINQDNKMAINECFNYDGWGEKFCDYCKENRGEFMSDKKFFFYIDMKKIEGILKTASIKNLNNFLHGIKIVYDFGNLNDFFRNDIKNIEYLLNNMSNIKEINNKKTRKLCLDSIQQRLIQSLELIKE